MSPKISGIKSTLFYVLGVLVAVFVVAQELIDYQSLRIELASEATDQQQNDDQGDENETVYEYTCELALPSTVVQLQAFIPVFIGTVIRESEDKEIQYPSVPLYDSPHYKTLFRKKISPNAP
ncbi:hypothetical protein EV198_3050 [Roseivirga ehrenbergii]|uniref:Uncharacterized protein n=1 Tax=Roseivirga ehrenbergii (strain DSM 102268 / JCM 13514 / KCTC 12282 / NCIMB 14502 / KMM 6017) TaxID=279360 RepID=A0A150XLD5_ROSEK|nr:hypothetical protein [Roseivirga ehrenbergii]KYG79559.1 hypothetical protein MB14_17000 [Roseivirga ehrenbergii]TCL01032.1 hypothetical protein EV198_3050 [Roseivirga ehrenbergii]